MANDLSLIDANQQSRILIISVRGFRFQVANCCIYEFEDLLCGLEQAKLYAPTSDFDWARKIYRLAKYPSHSDRLASLIAPFPQEISLDHEYDLIFAIMDNPWQMHLLESIKGWRDQCRHKACFIVEVWQPDLSNWRLLEEPFKNFDHIFLGVNHCTQQLAELVDRPCTYLPLAVDTLRFCPYPEPIQRSIDVCNIGRRSAQIHEPLFQRSREQNFFYYYDTLRKQKLEIENHLEHRCLLASLLQRSRYTINYFAKFNAPEETGGTEEIGSRFFESAAAGTVMIGMPPRGDIFPKYFDWTDAIVKVDLNQENIIDVIDQLDSQPERLAQISRNNIANSLLKHDWVYRWRDILATFNLEVTPAILEREQVLQQLAQSIQTETAIL
ncbi:glycosyltransferase [Pleurocapsa sp. PCC 7319]|uniref:glycosyltransferase family protein n=1 Tax=Pleurocapsa sp. PCC 7319 TaxID=118161 RepID=UPI00034D46FF|nr:glycosyltransferase [Pleurocapsa sp. PCC 7319]